MDKKVEVHIIAGVNPDPLQFYAKQGQLPQNLLKYAEEIKKNELQLLQDLYYEHGPFTLFFQGNKEDVTSSRPNVLKFTKAKKLEVAFLDEGRCNYEELEGYLFAKVIEGLNYLALSLFIKEMEKYATRGDPGMLRDKALGKVDSFARNVSEGYYIAERKTYIGREKSWIKRIEEKIKDARSNTKRIVAMVGVAHLSEKETGLNNTLGNYIARYDEKFEELYRDVGDFKDFLDDLPRVFSERKKRYLLATLIKLREEGIMGHFDEELEKRGYKCKVYIPFNLRDLLEELLSKDFSQ